MAWDVNMVVDKVSFCATKGLGCTVPLLVRRGIELGG